MEKDLDIWELPNYLGNGLDTCGTAYVFEKLLHYVGNDLSLYMWEMWYICVKWLKYLRNG